MDKKHCQGCYNDIYNHGQDPAGTTKCWSLKTAKRIRVVEIHVDAMPPFKPHQLKTQWKPSCYYRQSYAYCKKSAFTKDGYWR